MNIPYTPTFTNSREYQFQQGVQTFQNNGVGLPTMHSPQVNAVSAIPTNILENQQQYVVQAVLPGISKESVSIQFANQRLVIEFEQQPDGDNQIQHCTEPSHYLQYEWNTEPSAFREIFFPQEVDMQNAQASWQNGLLRITVPKIAGNSTNQLFIQDDGNQ